MVGKCVDFRDVYNDKLVYKVVIRVFFGVTLSKEKEALMPASDLFCKSYYTGGSTD